MLTTTIDIGTPPALHSVVNQMQAGSRMGEVYSTKTTSMRLVYLGNNAVTTDRYSMPRNNILSLGWTKAEALETYLRLSTFSEDWDYPGMEAYDEI